MLPSEIKEWSKQPRRLSLEALFRIARLEGHAIELACFGAGAHKPEGIRYSPYKGVCVGYTQGIEGAEALILKGGDENQTESPLWGTGYYVVPAALRPGVEARYVPDAWHVAANGTANEKDVTTCNVLVIDVDPQRPNGTNSDKAEYLGALDLGWTVREQLIDLGVPVSALGYGSSGNGCHVVIALEAAWSEEIKALRQQLLMMLGVLHDSTQFKIDPAMSDGARYVPVYGTAKKKGPNVGERKQRRSWLTVPEIVAPLSQEAFAGLVEALQATLNPEQVEALKKRNEKRPAARAAPTATDDSKGERVLDRCNAVSVSTVASELGIDPANPVCPGCGAEKGIDCLESKGKNVIKCQHATCGAKAWSPVALVMHSLKIDTLKSNKEGTKAVLSWFTSRGLVEGKRSRKAEAVELLRSEDITVDDDASVGSVLDALLGRVPASARGEELAAALKPVGALLVEADDLELDRVAGELNSRLGRGAPKKVLVDSLRKLRTAEKKADSETTGSGTVASGGFARGDSVELAGALIEALGGSDNVVFDSGDVHRYDESTGVWVESTVAELHKMLGVYAGRPKGNDGEKLRLSRSSVEGARKQAEDVAANPDFFRDGRPGFAFRNGFVRIDDKGVIHLDPHDRDNRAKYRYDFDWDPDREPLKLINFYGEIFKGDPEAHLKTQFLLEFYGASLIGEVWRAGKAIIKCGGGNDGKSVETQIMQAVFPAGAVQGVSPHDWGNDQKLAKLASARLNYAGELSSKEIRDPEIVKAVITGRDLVMAKVVYREPFSFYARCGHVMACNLPLPGVSDTSRGFWRRWELIEFTRSFLPEEENGMIVEEVCADQQAIACTLIQAAAQFVGNGHRFTEIPPSSAALKVEWQAGAEPVRRWITDDCRFSQLGSTEDELWSRFRAWCEDNRHMAMSSATFRGRLCSIMRDLARTTWADRLGHHRVETAKAGYLRGPDGERRYPIDTPEIVAARRSPGSAAVTNVGLGPDDF